MPSPFPGMDPYLENPEIFPFLGSSRLENPINQFNVSVVFHGHAHNGELTGKTSAQIPVFNVALPVISRKNVTELPLFTYELYPSSRSPLI